jgi:hypothetical protein
MALLFVLMTPGTLFRLPPGGGKWLVASVHAVLFALVYHLTSKSVWVATMNW